MPLFLTEAQLYRLIQRELPEGVYPDGPPSAFFSTADSDATAKVMETAYGNAEVIYNNIWPQSADEFLQDWEFAVFGYYLDSSLDLQTRRERVLGKIRAQQGIRPSDMKAITQSVIGARDIEIVEWNNSDGGWILDESQLEISTYLNGNALEKFGGNACLCPVNRTCLGLTTQELLDMQSDAYTYEVRIYDYTLTAQERSDLEVALNAAERFASFHIISDGLDSNDKIAGST